MISGTLSAPASTGFLAGHCRLEKYLKRLGLTNHDTFNLWNGGEKSAAHLLLDCEALVNHSLRSLGAYQLREPELPKLVPRKIMNFIKAIGLYDVLRMQSNQEFGLFSGGK